MKIFIVFAALLLVNVWALSYQGDIGRYTHVQTLLKATAEECAAGAALFLNEETYAEGRIEFDREAGQKYADAYLAYTVGKIKNIDVKSYNCSLSFDDDNCSVTARITLTTGDVFRLPFLSVTRIQRESKYEHVYI